MRDSDRDPPPSASIESDFPYREVNALAASEAYNKHHYRPTNYQHRWWARRLGSVFRSICIATLSDADVTAEKVWERYAEANDVEDAVVTDPPYYDSVQYSELADFFYIWLKQSLEADVPDIFADDTVVSENEAVGNRTRAKSLDDYERLLRKVFATAYSALKEDGPLVFTFYHRQPEAWGAVLESGDEVTEREAMHRVESVVSALNDEAF